MRGAARFLERIGEGAVDVARFAAEEMPVHAALAGTALLAMVVGVAILAFG